jgi:flagellin
LPNSGLNQKGVSGIDSSDSDLSAALTRVTSEISRIGSDLSSLEFASAYLSEVSTDLEVAYGRIMDVDIAEESANLAKYSMQYEAAAAAVAQANVAMSAALDLLLGSINQK